MRALIIALGCLWVFSWGYLYYKWTHNNEKELDTKLHELCEHAYFDGQKDALQGDIRIKKDRDSVYIWTKSLLG